MKFKTISRYFLIVNLLPGFSLICSAQEWKWAVKLNTGNTVYDMAVDNTGNAYLATGERSTIQKFDSRGNLIWAKSGESISFSRGLAIDQKNNLYVAGHGYHSIWDGQNTNHIRQTEGLCLYVMKLDGNGKIIWSTTLPKSGSFSAYDIEVDLEGSIYVHGGLSGYNTFLTKLNEDGTEAWYKILTGLNYTAGHGALGLDAQGNCYVTSDYGTNWYPKSSLTAKFDKAGNKLWEIIKNETMSRGIAVRPDGSFLIASTMSGGITKYDNTGAYVWNDGVIIPAGLDVELDAENNFYGVGSNYTNTIGCPVIAGWNEEGRAMWNIILDCKGASSADFVKSARIDATCYIAGSFINSLFIAGTNLESSAKTIYLGRLDCSFSRLNAGKSKLFPNPLIERSVLNFDNKENEIYTLKIFDARGQLIRSLNNIMTGSIIIERGNLHEGAYFYLLSDRSKRVDAGKFVVY